MCRYCIYVSSTYVDYIYFDYILLGYLLCHSFTNEMKSFFKPVDLPMLIYIYICNIIECICRNIYSELR